MFLLTASLKSQQKHELVCQPELQSGEISPIFSTLSESCHKLFFSKAFNVQFPSWTDDRVSPLFPSQLSTFVYNRQKSDSVEGPQQINLNCSQSDRLLYIPKQSVFSTLPPSKSSPSFPQYTLAPDHHYKTLLMTFRACYNLAPLLLTA